MNTVTTKFKIMCGESDRPEQMEVEGQTLGYFGVHPTSLEACGNQLDEAFVITHLLTGGAICWAKDETSAIKIMEHLNAQKIEWANLSNYTPAEFHRQINLISVLIGFFRSKGWLHELHDVFRMRCQILKLDLKSEAKTK